MKTASLKRKENIAEYLLYMWQIEDMIRANNLDIESITKNIIEKYEGMPLDEQERYLEWYDSLCEMMRLEGVEKSGHLQMNKNIISMLASLHDTLLKSPEHPEYAAEFYRTLPFIVELRAKAGENKAGEIETCFNALYAMLLMRLQGKEISKPTLEAMQQISKFVALLARCFKLDEEDKLFKNQD